MRYAVGIDEVGRGSLAGSVVIAAVCVPRGERLANPRLGRLRDSKKLTPNLRDRWFQFFSSHPRVRYVLARVYPKTIDRINISRAANLAALRAYRRLVANRKLPASPTRFAGTRARRELQRGEQIAGRSYTGRRATSDMRRAKVYLDGGLFLGNRKKSKALGAKTVVKGDEKVPAIKVASIIAKVSRDRLMKRLSRKYPKYGFEVHKGYGTRTHLRVLKKHGPCEAHRSTFLRFLQNSKR